MTQSVTPRGLICSLALVPNLKGNGVYMDLDPLITRLRPAVAGLFLDPMFWSPDEHHCGAVSATLLEEVIGLLPPRFPLWVRITRRTAEQTIDSCRQLETVCRRLNYEGPLAWVDTPLLYHSNRGLPDHYQTLLSDTAFNLIVDNDSASIRKVADKTKRKNIRTAILKKLSHQPRIVGLLHRGDLRRCMNYQRAVRGRSSFQVYDAEETGFLERPSASGVVSVGANLLPLDWRTITLSSLNLDESRQAHSSRFRQLWETGLRVRTLQKYYSQAPAQIIPAVLTAWGLIQENRQPLSPEEEKAVNLILDYAPTP